MRIRTPSAVAEAYTAPAMRNLALAPRPDYRPARAIRPAVAAAEARQRQLLLVHGGLSGGRRFDDPVPPSKGQRGMRVASLLLAVAALALMLDGVFL